MVRRQAPVDKYLALVKLYTKYDVDKERECMLLRRTRRFQRKGDIWDRIFTKRIESLR